MSLGDLWAYLSGYVRVKLTGPALERFVNLVSARGHRLWRTKRTARGLEADIGLAAFRRLRPAARKTRTRVRIVSRHGLPFVLGRAWRRPLLVAGVVGSLAILFTLTAFVWVIEIDGAIGLDPDLVREVAAGLGLRPGVRRAAVAPREVERGLLLAINGLSWAGVELRGTTALIRLVEKDPLERSPLPVAPADVVAARDGVITALIVLAGEPLRREGDTVRAGDVVVSGGPAPGVVARAIVRARVWYQGYAEVRRHTMAHVPTGRRWRTVELVLKDTVRLPLWGWWASWPADAVERAVERRVLPPWRNSPGDVELVVTTYIEVADVQRRLTSTEAETLAREAALSSLGNILPDGVEPVDYDFEVTVKDDILIGVLVIAETIEDIALIKERR